jgi:hypothetical protein
MRRQRETGHLVRVWAAAALARVEPESPDASPLWPSQPSSAKRLVESGAPITFEIAVKDMKRPSALERCAAGNQ